MAFLMIAWIYLFGLSVVFQTFVVPSSAAPAPAGMPLAPSVDPFAPPPPPNYPYQAHHMHYAAPPPPPMAPNGGYPAPQPPQYNYAQPPYNPQYNPAANMINPPPLPPVGNNPPMPMNAAPLGATGPSSSGSEQEFEGDKGGSSGYGYGGNYYQAPATPAYYGPPQGGLLDTYYHRPGYHGYGYHQPRQQNDIFGNLLGAFMFSEMVF